METIAQALSRTSAQHSARPSSEPCRLSEAQQLSIETFRSRFDTAERVFSAYAPKNWAYVVAHTEDVFAKPSVTLRQLDMIHGAGTAARLVANQITGIYSSTNSRDVLRQDALTQNSEMFVAKYGHECTLNAMMLYFANYPLEYKSSYGQFDIVDILQQFGKKFLPWWRMRQQPERPKEQQSSGAVGRDGLLRYLADEFLAGKTADQIKAESGLYRIGRLTDQDINAAMAIAQEEF